VEVGVWIPTKTNKMDDPKQQHQVKQHSDDNRRKAQKREYAKRRRYKSNQIVSKLKRELEEVASTRQFLLQHCENLRKANYFLLRNNEKLKEYLLYKSSIQSSPNYEIPQVVSSIPPAVVSHQGGSSTVPLKEQWRPPYTENLVSTQLSLPKVPNKWERYTRETTSTTNVGKPPETKMEKLPCIQQMLKPLP